MAQMFQMDMTDLKRLKKFYKRMPRGFRKASAGVLNSFAFGSRKQSLMIINRKLTIRTPRFIERTIRVDKAKSGLPIKSQQSEMGSTHRPRYTGLREQELGVSDKRTNIPTLAARRGQKRKKVPGSVRLKRMNQFKSPDDFPGKTAEHRVVVMLQFLERTRCRKPFVIKHHRRFTKGLYRFKGGKLQMVQTFEPSNKVPKRVRWLTGGRRKFMKAANIKAIWTDNLNRAVKSARRR